MGRSNYAIIVDYVNTRKGSGLVVKEIIDTQEETCCGYMFAWLRKQAWYEKSDWTFDRDTKVPYASDKQQHVIYTFKRNNWSNDQYVFFTKYPENYVNGKSHECHVCRYDGWSVLCPRKVGKLTGRFFMLNPLSDNDLRKIEKNNNLREELQARIEECEITLVTTQKRKVELREQLNNIPKHNFVD